MASTDQQTSAPATPRRAGPVTRRLVYALVLIPIVPTVSVIGVNAIDPTGAGTWDHFRWFQFLFSILWVVATIAIWRTFVIWTLGRAWLTALTALIPFVQVAVNLPLWDAGCVSEDVLRVGQHDVTIGLWVWCSIWVWWGFEKGRTAMTTDGTLKQVRMTPTARRIVASIGTIPFTVGIFFIVAMFFDDVLGMSEMAFVPAGYAVSAAMAVWLWLFIWRGAVAWSSDVVRWTIAIGIVSLAVPIFVLWLTMWLYPGGLDNFVEATIYCLPIIGWGVWMAVTVNRWPARSVAATSDQRVPQCLACGYLLIGLSSTRCPECGDEPTLDELWEATSNVLES